MEMLRRLASIQDASVSDLVREAIDLLIADRINNPRQSAEERRAKFDAFIVHYAGSQSGRNKAADEAAVDAITAERKSRRKPKAFAR